MTRKKQIQPGEKLPLKLSAAERTLVLEGLMCLDQEIGQAIKDTATGQPVMMTLDDLDDFGGYVAAEANHSEDKSKAKKLDAIFQKIDSLLGKYTDEAPPETIEIEEAPNDRVTSNQVMQIAQFAAQALVVAEQLGIKKKALEHFSLAPTQREVLSLVPGMTKALKKKLTQDGATFSIGEVASITLALAEDLPEGEARKQAAVMYVAQQLMDHLQRGIGAEATPKLAKKSKRKSKVASDLLFQFKITLLGIEPAIWRRIQVQDCTLDKLHEHIQTAMGWTNSHLHQFNIQGRLHGDPDLLEEYFEEFDCMDSLTTLVSAVLPRDGKRFTFKYEYDFGDGWKHEVLFEGCPPLEKGKKYPLCLEGERACPPEDVGSIRGYQSFLAAIADPRHKEHKRLLRWYGGKFSPEVFDPAKATKEMKKGLPDWRSME